MPPRGTFRKFSRPSIGARPWTQGKIDTPTGLAPRPDNRLIGRPDYRNPATAFGQVYALPIGIAFFVFRSPYLLLMLACPIVDKVETVTQPKASSTNHMPSPERIERTLTRAVKLLNNLADLAENPDSEIAQVTFSDLIQIETRLDTLELDIGKLIRPKTRQKLQPVHTPFVLTNPVSRNQRFGIEAVLAKISAENAPRTS